MKRIPFIIALAILISITYVYYTAPNKNSETSPAAHRPIEKLEKVIHVTKDNQETLSTSNGNWKLIFHDDFSTLNQEKWNVVQRGNNYNNELQYYRKENVQVADGTLRLTAKKQNFKKHNYTSGQITTKDKVHIHFGRIDIKAKYQEGKGLFPAIWLLPVNNKKTLPEIDIFEAIGQEPERVYMVNHYGNRKNYSSDYKDFKVKNYASYHTYSMEWDEEELRWYIDNQLRFSNKKGVPDEPMYLILNLAVGGNWPGKPNHNTEFPSAFEIDDVKIYEYVRR